MTASPDGWAADVLPELVAGAHRWWLGMASVAIQAAWVALLVALIDRLLPRRTWPALRSALWSLVLLRLALPPGLDSPLALGRWLPAAGHELMSAATPGTGAAVLAGEPAAPWWPAVAAVVWIGGAIALGLRGLTLARRARAALLAPGDLLRPAVLREVAERAGRRLGLRRLPRLAVSRCGDGPLVAGLVRPVVVVPASAVADTARLEHVLLHELAHVRRRDGWRAAAVAIVTTLHWFHPAAWIAARRLATLRELCCDADVAAALEGRTGPYRRTLLDASRHLARPEGALGLLGGRGPLLARLEWLERPVWRYRHCWRLASWSGAALVAAIVLPTPEAGRPAPGNGPALAGAGITRAIEATARAAPGPAPRGAGALRAPPAGPTPISPTQTAAPPAAAAAPPPGPVRPAPPGPTPPDVARPAGAAATGPWPGCLPRRYAVLAALSRANRPAAPPPETAPVPSTVPAAPEVPR